jgi:hypothetical protein
MRGNKKQLMFFFAWILLLLPVGALADSVSPSSYSTSLDVGQSITIRKTVTINAGTPTTAQVDVFFLTDSTGSMGSLIGSVKDNATLILTDTSTLGDVAYGVGEYKDVGDPYVYKMNQDITKNTTLVQDAINSWYASGGGDTPEANFYGLQQMSATSSWRTGSTRIALWFGDAPSHDPAGPSPGVTKQGAIDALLAKNIRVEAMNLASASSGINTDNQAQDIVNGAGGDLFSGIDPTTIVNEIKKALGQIFANYSTVTIGSPGSPAARETLSGVTVTVSPASYTGTYDRSIDRTFTFDVTFTANQPGNYTFDLPVLVDGGTMATERDTINVGGATVGNIDPIIDMLLNAGDAF